MPIYEYACKKCGDFEITQRITEPALEKCPTCGTKVSKLISQSAFHLKGTGWYVTDFKNGKPSKDSSDDSGDAKETKGESKNGSKNENKGGAKTPKTESKSEKKSSSSTSSSSTASAKTANSSST